MCTYSSLAVLGLVLSVGLAACAGEGARRRPFVEGFEGDSTITYWTDHAGYAIHFAGPTAERAARGKRSFKIHAEWTGPLYGHTWDRWWPAPLMVFYQGTPPVRAKLRIERGRARLGHPYAEPDPETSGELVHGERLRSLPNGWEQWAATASGVAGEARWRQAPVVWFRPDGEGHAVIYVDDLEVDAAYPAGDETALRARKTGIEAAWKTPLLTKASALRARFRALMHGTAAARPGASRLPEALAAVEQRLGRFCRRAASELGAQLAQLERAPTHYALDAARRKLALLAKARASRRALGGYAQAHGDHPYLVWTVDPTSNEQVLPTRFPVPGVVGTELGVTACRGEYVPASFAVTAVKNLSGVIAEPAEARCGGAVIPASAIDIRLVKCWWQAGVACVDITHPTLVPELLLKDPDFVRVDNARKRNVLRDPKAPKDAQELQPVSIAAGTTQQFWVTVHVPDDAQPGTYRGAIRLRAEGVAPLDLALTVRVLPFRLEESPLQYSIYYHGTRSDAQYLAEMRDLKAHGVTHPTCVQGVGPQLDRVIALRKQAGIAIDPFYAVGVHAGTPRSAEELKALRDKIAALVSQLARHGVREVYVYGVDEAAGDQLKATRAAYQVVHEAGAKMFVACYTGAFELVGDLLDLANHSDTPLPSEAAKWHRAGRRIFNYGNPQCGIEQPETYRRNYGLLLWKAGYDGAMDWAYQFAAGKDIYDDFGHERYRDFAFAYPTVDGVIDTIQWEGFREGVDDVRYLATLLKAIEHAKAHDASRPLAAQAERWIEAMDIDGDLNALRAEMVDWILQLKR